MAIAERKFDGAVVYEVTIDNTIYNSKTVTLSVQPSTPDRVILDVIGGSAQSLNTDFKLNGSNIEWGQMGLEAMLSVGDKIRIIVFT